MQFEKRLVYKRHEDRIFWRGALPLQMRKAGILCERPVLFEQHALVQMIQPRAVSMLTREKRHWAGIYVLPTHEIDDTCHTKS